VNNSSILITYFIFTVLKNGRMIKATRREGDWEKMRNEEDENRRKVKGLVTVPATN